MDGALTLLLTGFLLQGAQCDEFNVSLPQTVQVMRGSCVTVLCSFTIKREHEGNLNENCEAKWTHYKGTVSQLTETNPVTGDLTKKDCTTTFNNMELHHSNTYYFRLECDNPLKYTFNDQSVKIEVTDAPPPFPTLTPPTLEVKEGTSVSLTCSAPAACLTHRPTLTWSPRLGDVQETLKENQNKTNVQISVLNFTASHLHHGQEISCTAVYKKQDGGSDVSRTTSLRARILCAQCDEFKVSLPQTVQVMRGSCVTVLCSFTIKSEHEGKLNEKCKAKWLIDGQTVSRLTETNPVTGDLTKKNCTTTFNKMELHHSNTYYFRLECDNDLKYYFKGQTVKIEVTDAPPPFPTLTPPTLEVKEGTSVSLTCSAPAACLTHPPTLTWSPRLGDVQETLKENQDKTNVQISVLNFTASHLHHGQEISCTAVYKKQDGGSDVSRTTSLRAKILYSPKDTKVSVSPSDPVPENSNMTLTCSSEANPAVKTYTWFRADGDQQTVIGTGRALNITASTGNRVFVCKAESSLGAGRSENRVIDVQFPPQILSSSDCSKTVSQLSCSCEAVGNPSPTVLWHLDGQTVSQSNKMIVIKESMNDTDLRSIITVDQPQERDLSTLLCYSFNSLGSASKQFFVDGLQTSGENPGKIPTPVFITTVTGLSLLVCVLLLVNRYQKTHQNPRSLSCEDNTINSSQHLVRQENEVLKAATEAIYENTEELRQADDVHPAAVSNCRSPSSGCTNKTNRNSGGKSEDGVYSSVKVRKKRETQREEMNADRDLSQERSMEGADRDFLSNALVMGSLYAEVQMVKVKKEVESEYALVEY